MARLNSHRIDFRLFFRANVKEGSFQLNSKGAIQKKQIGTNLIFPETRFLSISVDSVIHLYHRRMELGAGKIPELFRTTGSAVLTGTLNNAFGFVGLCFVSHKGMQTIGFLATLGIGAGIVVMFTLLPWMLEKLCPVEPQVE